MSTNPLGKKWLIRCVCMCYIHVLVRSTDFPLQFSQYSNLMRHAVFVEIRRVMRYIRIHTQICVPLWLIYALDKCLSNIKMFSSPETLSCDIPTTQQRMTSLTACSVRGTPPARTLLSSPGSPCSGSACRPAGSSSPTSSSCTSGYTLTWPTWSATRRLTR